MFARFQKHNSSAPHFHPACRDNLAHSLLLLWAFWLCAEYLVFGRHSYALIFDFGDSFIPYFMGENRNGFWAFLGGWEPRMLAGVDAAANTISQFRLTNLGISVMPAWMAIGLFAFLQRAIAAVFMYRLVIDVFDGHRGAAFATAMLFAVGLGAVGAESYFGFTHNMGLAPCGVPFLIWAHWRWADRRPAMLAAIMFACGALLALATMQFIAIQALVCTGLLLGALTPVRRWWTLLLPLFALGLGYTVMELPNVIAVLADWPAAHRLQNPTIPTESRLKSILSGLTQMGTFQFVPIFTIVFAFLFVTRQAIPAGLAAVVGICIVILFIDVIVSAVFPDLSTLANFSFIRIIFMMPFLLLLVAGIALSRIFQAAPYSLPASLLRRAVPVMLAIGITTTAVGQDTWIKFNNLRYYSHGSNYATLYDQPPLRKVAALSDDRNPFRVATVNIKDVTHLNRPSFAWAYGLETVDGYVNVYPRRYQELWVEVIRPSADKTPFDFEKMRDWGNRVYLTAPGPDCSSVLLGASTNLELLSLLNVRFIVSPCPLQDSNLRLFAANLEGPGQAWHKWSNKDKLMSIFRGDYPSKKLYVYENAAALPRYFLAGNVRIFDTPAEALAALGKADRQTLLSTAMIAREDIRDASLPQENARQAGTVQIISVDRGEIRLDVTAKRKSVLIAANSFNPRWTATVNGRERPLFRADHAFQGVVVESGRSEVVLRYRSAISELMKDR
jgi:hypothetical protein